MPIQQVFQDEINASQANKKAGLEAIEAAASQTPDRDPDTGARYLGKYAIPAAQWDTWAAAAGYPGAKWGDPTVMQAVAGWAADTLYEEFGNWSLVAIGWRYGAGMARQIRSIYGGTPAQNILDKFLDVGGTKFIQAIVDRMGQAQNVKFGQELYPPIPQGGGGGGSMSLTFKTEEGFGIEEPTERKRTANNVLTGVLGAMADRIAGGTRGQIADADPQRVEAVDEPEVVAAPESA